MNIAPIKNQRDYPSVLKRIESLKAAPQMSVEFTNGIPAPTAELPFTINLSQIFMRVLKERARATATGACAITARF